MSSQAHVIIKQNEYMRKFRNAGAVDGKSARTPAELGVKPDRIFRKMVDKEVFRQGRTPDRYYLDTAAAGSFVEARRKRAFYMFLLIIAVFLALFFLGRR